TTAMASLRKQRARLGQVLEGVERAKKTFAAGPKALRQQAGTAGAEDSPGEEGAGTTAAGGAAYPGTPVCRRLPACGANWELRCGDEDGSYAENDYSALAAVAKLVSRPHHGFKLGDLVGVDQRALAERPGDDVLDEQALNELKRKYEELQETKAKYPD